MRFSLQVCLLAALATVSGCKTPSGVTPGSLVLTIEAADQAIQVENGKTEITVEVADADGLPAGDGIPISFVTTLGKIPDTALTVRGTARVFLRSTGTKGAATVTALTEGASAVSIEIVIGIEPASISVVANPSVLPTGGGSAGITAVVTGTGGVPVAKAQVIFETTGGTLSSGGVAVPANGQGRAVDTLTTDENATVTASLKDNAAINGEVVVTVDAVAPANLNLFANPSSLAAGGGDSTILVVATDTGARPVAGATVNLTTTSGTLSATRVTTDSLGQATVRLTTISTSIVNAQSATGSAAASVSVSVGTSSGALLGAIEVFASPTSLPPGGNPSPPGSLAPVSISALVYDTDGFRLPGVAVAFSATQGTLSSGSTIVSNTFGESRNNLRTQHTSTVTVSNGGFSDSVTVYVEYLRSSADRMSVNDATLPGTIPCTSSSNPQIPITIGIRLDDGEGTGIDNVAVELSTLDEPTDPNDGFGHFCPSGSTATVTTGTTGPGEAEIQFAFDSSDFAGCPAGATCRARIRAVTSSTQIESEQDLILTFLP